MGNIKGLAIIPTVKALRHLREKSDRAIDPALRHYLTENIFPSRWYPEADLMGLLHTLVSILPPRPKIWEWIGAEGAAADFTNIYAAFIRPGRPEFSFERYARIWRLYHDNGRVNVICSPGQVEIEISSRLTQLTEFCRLQAGHFACMLKLGGARAVEVSLVKTGDDQTPARWVCTWQPPARS